MPNDPKHRHASVDGVGLHWVELGSHHDRHPPVVLLHGLYDSHGTWDQVARSLACDRTVFALDLPGHGLSERPDASYELEWHAQMVSRWLQSCLPSSAAQAQIDVVGHSFGGGVAQMLLLASRARVRRLVLEAAGGLGREIRAVLRLASLPLVVELFGQPFMGIGTRLALQNCVGFTRKDLDELATMNAREGSARAFARTVRDIIDWRGQRRGFRDRAHELDELPPIAVLWGERDDIIPIAHGERFAEEVQGVRFVRFEGCGHYVHREQPEAFVETVRAFLDADSACAARWLAPTRAA